VYPCLPEEPVKDRNGRAQGGQEGQSGSTAPVGTTHFNDKRTASLLSKILGRISRKYAQVQISKRRTVIKDEKSKIADILCSGNVKNKQQARGVQVQGRRGSKYYVECYYT
jgi:hypothetical protein